MASKIFLMAYQNIEMLRINLKCLRMISNVNNENIIIIDMGIDRDIQAWLEGQNEFDYICAENLENYARILNTAIKEFSTTENILILNTNLICLGNCIKQLEEISSSDDRIGAIAPTNFNDFHSQETDIATALRMVEERRNRTGTYLAIKLPYQCVFLTRNFIDGIGDMDEQLLLPDTVFLDYSFRGLCQKWKLALAKDVFVYEMILQPDYYTNILGLNADRDVLKTKWGMNYFNGMSNENLIKAMDREKDEEFAVLEIGCDCGANLVRIKNLFSQSKLFGLEINPSAAAIASNFGEVQIGNIEEYDLAYSAQSFDYIIFGDVLEHLRNPEKVVAYCKGFLKPHGKIIASIPNLMHYTVLKSLIGGDFTYQDIGLLDRTHIHFFTYNEIVRMFLRAGYQIDTCSFTTAGDMSEEDKRFVGKLKDIGHCEAFTYIAFQYLITASCMKTSDDVL